MISRLICRERKKYEKNYYKMKNNNYLIRQKKKHARSPINYTFFIDFIQHLRFFFLMIFNNNILDVSKLNIILNNNINI